MSSWNKDYANPRLDSPTTACLKKSDGDAYKDYWIETDFTKPAEVYQLILKRRADMTPEKNPLTNTHVKVQYQDADTKKWIYYKNGALIPTGETSSTPTEFETKINLFPFRAMAVAVWIH